MTYEQLYKAYSSLSPDLQKMLDTFVLFLKEKNKAVEVENGSERKPGLAKGLIEMKDNFDDPIEGFENYM